MATVHLIEGPVGAGKSSYALKLARELGTVPLALDAWFAQLYSPDRPSGDFIPWYIERKERLMGMLWRHSQQWLASGHDVVLELGLIQRQPRQAFCRQVLDAGHALQLHVLDAPRELRRERVRRRNVEQGETFAMLVPDSIFELASDLWEAPDEDEAAEWPVRWQT